MIHAMERLQLFVYGGCFAGSVIKIRRYLMAVFINGYLKGNLYHQELKFFLQKNLNPILVRN